jgi:hypothetical protein
LFGRHCCEGERAHKEGAKHLLLSGCSSRVKRILKNWPDRELETSRATSRTNQLANIHREDFTFVRDIPLAIDLLFVENLRMITYGELSFPETREKVVYPTTASCTRYS